MIFSGEMKSRSVRAAFSLASRAGVLETALADHVGWMAGNSVIAFFDPGQEAFRFFFQLGFNPFGICKGICGKFLLA